MSDYFLERKYNYEKPFAISSMQICGGCFQSQSKPMWMQLYGGCIVLSSWHKMKQQNRAVESVVEYHNGACLNETCCHCFNRKYFRYFRSFLSGLPSFWSQSLAARPKTRNEFLVLSFYFSKCFQLIFHTFLSSIQVLFVTLKPLDPESILWSFYSCP